ncbi:MAG: hypothetical protein ACXVI3_02060 [Halobacteriota archaeon]
MSYEITLCACKNTGDLDFSIGGNRKTGLGNVSFVVTREKIVANDKTGSQDLPSTIRFKGMFYPKDVESADILLQHCIEGDLITIHGRFKDAITEDDADYTLTNVLFQTMQFDSSHGWPFIAKVERS